jgi:hypothetical protein
MAVESPRPLQWYSLPVYPDTEESMRYFKSLLASLSVVALVMLSPGRIAAEPEGIPGSTSWSPQTTFFCTQGGDNRCRYWYDEVPQTDASVAPCGGLYLFPTHYYVLVYCGSIPWP